MVEIPVSFDATRARRFRKRAEILAFRSDDAITYHKSWGTQEVPANSWVAIPLDQSGAPTGNVYGIDGEVFASTYVPAADKPHVYRKTATVEAYQPGHAFVVRTEVGDRVETQAATGGPSTWLLRNPGGEVYPVEDDIFRRDYTLTEGEEVP